MCYRCDQNNNQNEDPVLCISKRSFLKLSAASAVSLGIFRAGIANAGESVPVKTTHTIPLQP